MKKWIVLGLLVLAAIATMYCTTVLTTRLFFAKEKILMIEVIPMDFEVDDYVGIFADNDSIHFGTIPPGNIGKRFIVLDNSNTFPVTVTVNFRGEAGKYVWATPELILGPGEEKEITIRVNIPSDLPHGNYTGTAHFTFREA